MNAHDIARTFSGAESIIRAKLQEQETYLEKYYSEYRRLEGKYIKEYSDPRRAKLFAEVVLAFNQPIYFLAKGEGIVSLEKRAKQNRKILEHIKLQKTPRSTRKVNFENKLQRARVVPIDSILEFDRSGKAHCVFHQEKTPSMKYYAETNKVKCFGGCQRYADGIDVVRHLYNYSFVEAVDYLSTL